MKHAIATLAALALACAAPAQAPVQRANCTPSRATVLTPVEKKVSRLINLAEKYHDRITRTESRLNDVEQRLGNLESWRTEADGRLAALERKYATPALASANGLSRVATNTTNKENGNATRNGNGHTTHAAQDEPKESPPRARTRTLTGENTITIPKLLRYRIVIQIVPVDH